VEEVKRILPVLVLFAGMGHSISFAQAIQHRDPFDRYLAAVRANRPEPSLVRFAADCGIDVEQVRAKFAVNPGSEWSPVNDIALGVKSLDSDFFSTVQIWFDGNRVVLELWALSLDVGSEVRIYHCFVDRKEKQALAVAWNLPLLKDSPEEIAWGYQQRWERATDGRMQRKQSGFVNERLQSIPQPQLGKDAKKSLEWSPIIDTLDDLRLPPVLLR
jgi:outer membrane protein assembly factor BamA